MNIQLPGFVIAQLYPDSIVLVGDKHKTLSQTGAKDTKIPAVNNNPQPPQKEKWWMGDNLKHISLIVNDPANRYISDASLSFLGKILAACKCNIADTAILNIAHQNRGIQQIKEELSPKIILLFQVRPQQIGLSLILKDYHPENLEGCTYLYANSLAQMNHESAEARQEKTRLWISLKQIFKL